MMRVNLFDIFVIGLGVLLYGIRSILVFILNSVFIMSGWVMICWRVGFFVGLI